MKFRTLNWRPDLVNSHAMHTPRFDQRDRRMALHALVLGVVGSIILLLLQGQDTPPMLLFLFFGWVLSPFMGLLLAGRLSGRWSDQARFRLLRAMIVIPNVSVIVYGYDVLVGFGTRPAFMFLMVPLVSWGFVAFVGVRGQASIGV
jgi:hypothetical protein